MPCALENILHMNIYFCHIFYFYIAFQVVQKAVIEVDEEGTEAAAASGSEITAFTVPPAIKVDRPFLFMIFEETFKTLLFIGRVVDPTET